MDQFTTVLERYGLRISSKWLFLIDGFYAAWRELTHRPQPLSLPDRSYQWN